MDVPVDVPALGLECFHVRSNVGKILIPTPSVNHQVNKIITDLGDHRVIDGASALIGEDRESPSARFETGDIGDHKTLEEGDAVLAHEAEAAHMGDVEEAAIFAAVDGGVHDGILVLDGHAPSGEGDHLAAIFNMEVMEDGFLELTGGGGGGEGTVLVAAVGMGVGEAAGEGLAELPEGTSSHGDGEREWTEERREEELRW